MLAAGIEGGCKKAILKNWTLQDYDELAKAWKRGGLPVHTAVSMYLGLIDEDTPDNAPQDLPEFDEVEWFLRNKDVAE